MDTLTTEEFQSLILSVGTHRRVRRLTPLGVATLLDKAIAGGASRNECAVALSVKADQISRFLRLLKLSPEIRCLAGWGRNEPDTIPFTTLTFLDRLRSDDQIVVADAITKHRLTKEEVKQVIQVVARSGSSATESIRRVLQLRPRIETRYVFFGVVQSDESRKYIAGISDEQRDSLIQNVISDLVGNAHSVRCHLGPVTFSISSDTNLTDLIDSDAQEVEESINRLIDRSRTEIG